MKPEQILIGGVLTAICLQAFWSAQAIVDRTRKGERLVRWLGRDRALLVLRALLAGGAIVGVLLATNVLRPLS